MRNPKVAMDVDDVIAAFTPHAHDFHKVPLEKCDYWCVQTMDKRLGQYWFGGHIAPVENFWKTLPVLNPASDIDFEVDCYISSFPPDMFQLRLDWLKQHGFPDAPLFATSDKLTIMRERGVTHLVDDKPATIKLLQGTEITGIHFMTDYAGFEPVGPYVITNLKQVKPILEEWKIMAQQAIRA